MAFPQTPLPVSHLIAPGADPAKPSTYQFTDVTSDVRYASAIQISAGRQDEHSTVSTTGHQVTLDNRAGNYSPRNPLGTWYGQLRKGTPSQTRITLINDLFARTVATGLGTDAASGQSWSTSVAYSVNGTNGLATFATANLASASVLATVCSDDFDLLKVTSMPAVMTGAAWVDATMVRYQDGNNFYRLHTEYGLSGNIQIKIDRIAAGVTTTLIGIFSPGPTYTAGTKISTRIQAIGPTIRMKVWQTSGAEPAAWSISVDDTSTTVRGNAVGLYTWRVAGNTNAGSLAMSIYSFRVDSIRATTPVPEWPARWNQTGSNATSPVVGAGVMRRLSQGQSALRSPLYRGLLDQNPAGFFPLEDASGATVISSAVPGVIPGRVSDVTAGNPGPPGASSAITTNSTTSVIYGSTNGPNTATGYSCLILVKYSALPGSTQPIVQWTTTGTVTNWYLVGDGASFTLTGDNSASTTIVAPGPFLYGLDPTKWWAVQLETNVSGGTVNWAIELNQVGSTTFAGTSGSYSGSATKATSFRAGGQANVSYSMAWLGDNSLNYVGSSFSNLASGFAGELAGVRALRLAAEENVPLQILGDPTKTAAMGVQTSDTFINLIRECEDADQGLLIERGAGLGFLTNRFRLNVPVTMALDFNSGHIAAPPEPTDDDLNLINVVKVTRKNGSESTAQNNTSIALSGAYTDEREVNVYLDAQLEDQAGWRLHLGTIDELRWPVITLQLHANPALIYTWCQMRIGSRITIANPPTPGDTLDLIVEGYTERIGQFTWDVTINCSPARPWDCGIYSDARTRYTSARNPDGTSATTLTAGISSGATSVGITTANTFTVVDPTWSTTAVPYTWEVGGEQMTVTAMTARSGTGPWTQTATVTRNVNNLPTPKAHVAGEAVDLAAIRYYALPV